MQLLSQAAVPVSMIISKIMLTAKYSYIQFFGATLVCIGLLISLWPSLNGGGGDMVDMLVYGGLIVGSCVPMCLSSVYKEIRLGEKDVDVVYFNGMVALWQLLFTAISLPLMVIIQKNESTGEYFSISDAPAQMRDGLRCIFAIDSSESDNCAKAPIFLPAYIVVNICFNILIIVVLKVGGSNLLWLAMTVMVPFANVSFSLDVMKHIAAEAYVGALKPTDVIGLVVIMVGLITYRFIDRIFKRRKERGGSDVAPAREDSLLDDMLSLAEDDEDEAGANAALLFSTSGTPMASEGLLDHKTSARRRRRLRRKTLPRKSAHDLRASYLARKGFFPPGGGPGVKAARHSSSDPMGGRERGATPQGLTD